METARYVVHTDSGNENKVKLNLDRRREARGMDDKRFRVISLEAVDTEYTDGEKKTAMKKFFPGYVLVEMIMTDDSWYVVRNTPRVTGFLGSSGQGTKPTPLLPHEVDQLLKQMGMSENKVTVTFEMKENVKVTDGPFSDFMGTIEHIDAD